MKIRSVQMGDARNIQNLVNTYAKEGEMLPLSLQEIYEGLREFLVAYDDEKILGVCALRITWENLGEIRSLAVHPDYQKRGIGKFLVKAQLQEAGRLGIKRVFVLTSRNRFFETLGFKKIDKAQLPHKVWTDCIKCIKFPDCDENAYIFDLEDTI